MATEVEYVPESVAHDGWLPEVEIAAVESSKSFEELDRELEALVRHRTDAPHLAHSRNLLKAIFVLKASRPMVGEPMIVTVRLAGRLACVLPLYMGRTTLGCREARLLGDPLLPYGDLICHVDHDEPHSLPHEILKFLRSRGVDILRCRRILSDTATALLLPNGTRHHRKREQAPFIRLSSFPDYDTYLRSLNAKSRKSRRRHRRQLEKMGTLTFRLVRVGPEASRLMDVAFDMKRRWLAEKGEIGFELRNEGFIGALRTLACDDENAVVSVLELDGTPLAIELGYVNGRSYFSYLAAYEFDYAKYGPGCLQLEGTIQWCFDQGIEIFDMLPPANLYKKSWCNESREICNVAIPVSWMGSLVCLPAIQFRDLAKAIWDRTPSRFRAVVLGLRGSLQPAASPTPGH